MRDVVQTVLGPVPIERLGRTLMHEHLQIAVPGWQFDWVEPPMRFSELVARCVVETGTTTYYETLRNLATEPVLADLANRIRTDEVQHYKYFFQYFRKLQASQKLSRARIAAVLYKRLAEMRESDSDVALRHVWQPRRILTQRGVGYVFVEHQP